MILIRCDDLPLRADLVAQLPGLGPALHRGEQATLFNGWKQCWRGVVLVGLKSYTCEHLVIRTLRLGRAEETKVHGHQLLVEGLARPLLVEQLLLPLLLGLLVGPDAPVRGSQRGQVVEALHVPHHLLLDGREARHHAPHHGVSWHRALGHEPRASAVLSSMLTTLVRKWWTS